MFLGIISYEDAFKKLFPWTDIILDEEIYEPYDEDDILLTFSIEISLMRKSFRLFIKQ
ncbi:hypothetical protein PB1_02650 [Bacillus methanolicus PB1]|uniref:Uncharacterized protein n=1 Tax=Bacillus methanolicus PB1 TaxID=997296 RepID=I3E5N2_BACMT|nr:hypothetical protein PB1_02650 [Bacillus methanolicus PB1]